MRFFALALILLFTTPALAKRHTVKSGDTLGKVAKRYKCSVKEVKRANKMKSDSLSIGDKLRIPRCKKKKKKRGKKKRAGRRSHKVRKGDSLHKIGKKYTCTVKELKRANRLKSNNLRVGQRLRIPYCTKGDDVDFGGKVKPLKERKRKRFKNGRHKLDKKTLETVMRAHGFSRPRRFLAYVLEVTLSKNGKRIVRERPFAWGSTSNDPNWNPASTIKLFSTVAALEMAKGKGFSPNTRAEFHDPGRAPRTYLLADLVADCLIKSDNIAHNRLVQIAGWDFMNGQTLRRRGQRKSAIHKPYEKSVWVPLTGTDHFKDSPMVRLRSGGRMRTLRPRAGRGQYDCMGSSACSTMKDLAQAMRRLMLHEQLPGKERYNLDRRGLQIIRKSLKKRRKRGNEVADGIRNAFRKGGVTVYHKPGFSEGWMSDVAYVVPRNSRKRYIIAVAGYRGRSSLNSAARVLSQIVKDDELEYY